MKITKILLRIKFKFLFVKVLIFGLSFAENFSFCSRIAVDIIKLYQVYISPLNISSCRYKPTCSNYAIESIEKYGFLTGFLMSSDRLLRCNPFGKLGTDLPQEHYIFSKCNSENFEYLEIFNEILPNIEENENEIIKIANFFFNNKFYDKAALEYEKFLYLFPYSSIKIKVIYYLVFCYIKQTKYNVALEVLDSLPQKLDGIERILYNLFSGLVYLSTKEYHLARYKFKELIKLNLDQRLREKVHILYILSLLKEEKFNEAEKELNKIKSSYNFLMIENLVKEITKIKMLRKKSLAFSAILSLIPGLGKIYSGEILDGVFSFIFLSSIAYLSYETYEKKAYVSFSVWSVFFVTFYSGNIYGSIDVAKKYNEKIENKCLKNMEYYVIEILRQLK